MGLPIQKPDLLARGISTDTVVEDITLFPAAASFNLTTFTIPKGASVIATSTAINLNCPATTATNIGLGRATATADPDKYWLSGNLAAGNFSAFSPTPFVGVNAEETLAIFACTSTGNAAGTIGGAGVVATVSVTYAIPNVVGE